MPRGVYKRKPGWTNSGSFKKGERRSPSTEFKKGNIPWIKGLSIKTNDALTEWVRENGAWNKGTKGLIKPNLGSFKKGERKSPATEFKVGRKPWFADLPKSKHPAWQGGLSFEPYGVEFNNELRSKIRKRDGFKCRECNYSQEELGYELSVHHIDYNKKNNKEDNLISLCKTCHAQTNFGREEWAEYFKGVV